MPPKARFSKEEITHTALELIRQRGDEGLTARALGKALNSSACPIFTVFETMEEVRSSAKNAAKDLYAEYVRAGLSEVPAFKGVGMQYIQFAIQEPKLFQLLFMSEQTQSPTMDNILPVIDENYSLILRSVEIGYGLRETEAERLYRHLWIYTHGIAVLCATKLCRFTLEEMSAMLTDIFLALLEKIKKENGGT